MSQGLEAPDAQPPPESEPPWRLKLYVAGDTPKSLAAFANLKRVCEKYLSGLYHIETVDLHKNPALAKSDQIVALPSLVRLSPLPVKKVIGDLGSEERLSAGLNL